MTQSFFIQGTTGIFSIVTTRDVSHLVKGISEAIVALSIVLIVWRITLSKAICSGLVSLMSDTKKDL